MAAETELDSRAAAIDAALMQWRQGDCVLGEHWFVTRFDLDNPLSSAALTAAREGIDLADEQVRGLAVVTQTCDIVRSCVERPFVEVCPLVEVDDSTLKEIAAIKRPAYALVPILVSQRLVAELDRTMTLEKPVLAKWSRTPGWTTDAEARAFAQALARKRARFAYPDDFTTFVEKLQARVAGKHKKGTDEGRGLRALREIRVRASPGWDANPAELFFWFVRHDVDADFEGKNWAELLKEWLKLVPTKGRFTEVEGQVVALEEMTAADYVGSDRLDLDYLSSRTSST